MCAHTHTRLARGEASSSRDSTRCYGDITHAIHCMGVHTLHRVTHIGVRLGPRGPRRAGTQSGDTARRAVCGPLRVVMRGMLRVVQGRRDHGLTLIFGDSWSFSWRSRGARCHGPYVFASQRQAATAEFGGRRRRWPFLDALDHLQASTSLATSLAIRLSWIAWTTRLERMRRILVVVVGAREGTSPSSA